MISIRDFLQQRSEAGAWSIGQIAITGLALRHVEDRHLESLEVFQRPEDARELAKYDAAGAYRPLKTAPNLRRGWRLELASLDELRLALDFFYPAALGSWLAYARDDLPAGTLRNALGRQSGMYRVTQLITDAQADELIRQICDPETGCLRHQIWDISPGLPSPVKRLPSKVVPDALPILCTEACNLLIAACRPLAKQNLPKVETAS